MQYLIRRDVKLGLTWFVRAGGWSRSRIESSVTEDSVSKSEISLVCEKISYILFFCIGLVALRKLSGFEYGSILSQYSTSSDLNPFLV
jgi:hypothetical protein